MSLQQIIDRRLSGKNKSIGNRERFLRRPKDQIREAVRRAVSGRGIRDMERGEEIFGAAIPMKRMGRAEELAAAKVAFEVVPGVSSFFAGPNYAGIPVTHRDHCSSFTVLTGHEDPTKDESSIDWAQLAKSTGTKVVLMGVERIRRIAEQLIAHGMAAQRARLLERRQLVEPAGLGPQQDPVDTPEGGALVHGRPVQHGCGRFPATRAAWLTSHPLRS